jgi:hypothetical protein
MNKPRPLHKAFLRCYRIGASRVNANQLRIIIVNVPEQVNGCKGGSPSRATE